MCTFQEEIDQLTTFLVISNIPFTMRGLYTRIEFNFEDASNYILVYKTTKVFLYSRHADSFNSRYSCVDILIKDLIKDKLECQRNSEIK